MDRRKQAQIRWREQAFGAIRLLFFAAIIVGAYYGVRYTFSRSAVEIKQITEKPESQIYLDSRDVAMKVIDDSGQLSMIIEDAQISLSADQKTAVFSAAEGAEHITAKFLEDGEISLWMEAGQIDYDVETEDFVLTSGLRIETSDGMVVTTDMVEWRRVKQPEQSRGIKDPSFRFPNGVHITSRDGNELTASYMQADKELMYLQMVGNVTGVVRKLEDTEFISERELTDVEDLKLEDFETLTFMAEKVIYDKRNEVMLATSRFYDREFVIRDMDGRVVRVEDYQSEVVPVTFAKKEITIRADHLEAHIRKQWVECLGNVDMVIPPAEADPNEDKSLKVVKRFETRIAAQDIEYFWGRDYILTHGATRIEQDDRLAMSDDIIYWGDARQVLLNGNITMVQGSGEWLFDEDLVAVEDHDMQRAVSSYSELYADRAVFYLDNNDFIASGDVYLRQDEREVAAETIVYQDEIKRITADGNVRFVDKDNQELLANYLVFHNEVDYVEILGGASATLMIPAKYSNDINRTLADIRETAPPAEVSDPETLPEPPRRNPNEQSGTATNLQPIVVGADEGSLPRLRIPRATPSDNSEVQGATGDSEDIEDGTGEEQPEGNGGQEAGEDG